jgi:hypothetical protein
MRTQKDRAFDPAAQKQDRSKYLQQKSKQDNHMHSKGTWNRCGQPDEQEIKFTGAEIETPGSWDCARAQNRGSIYRCSG